MSVQAMLERGGIGMVIHYCDKCGLRVSESDLAAGKARLVDETHAICSACGGSPKRASTRGSDPNETIGTPPGTAKRDSHRSMAPVAPSAVSTSRSVPSAFRVPAASSRSLVFVGVAVGVVLLIAVLAMLAGGGDETPKRREIRATTPNTVLPDVRPPPPVAPLEGPGVPKPDGNEVSKPDRTVDYDPRATVAQLLLEEAKSYQRKHPDDVWGYHGKLQNLCRSYARTASADEASRIIAGLSLPPTAPADGLPPEDDWAKAIDLLPCVELPEDALHGDWKREGGAFVSPIRKTPSALLSLPYLVPDEYDVRVTFVRRQGNDALGLVLRRKTVPVCMLLAGWQGKVHGFEMVRGQRADQIPDNLRQDGLIQTGRQQNLIVQARHGAFKAYVDGRRIAECLAPNEDLAIHTDDWHNPHKRRLVIGTWETSYEIQRVQLIERTGQGSWVRKGTVAADPGSQPTPPGPSTGTSAVPALPVTARAPAAYMRIALELQSVTAQRGWTIARSRLEEARKDGKLASFKADLASDAELIALAEKAQEAIPKGAALLADGRTFMLIQTGEKRTLVGEGARGKVTGVTKDLIEIEEQVGGGRLSVGISLKSLAPETFFELARMGLPDDGERELALALMRWERRETPKGRQELEQLIAEAAKRGAPAAKVAQARKWLGILDREEAARKALAELEALIAARKPAEAVAALAAFIKDYVATLVADDARARLAELPVVIKGLEIQPGLWASYWAKENNNDFGRLLVSRVAPSLQIFWTHNRSPDPAVPHDWFGSRFAGILRVPKAGRYEFYLYADDLVRVWIDGQKRGEAPLNSDRTFEIDLTAGDHAIRVELFEAVGEAILKIQWKPPGETERCDVPADALWHDPFKKEEYEKP